MIGLDTLLFTKDGFKRLGDLDLYDEVLTPLGVFKPIIKMSKVEDIDYYVRTSTDELIACSRDLELPVYENRYREKIVYVDGIKDNKYCTTKILPFESNVTTSRNLYEEGVKIPNIIDNKIFRMSSCYRYELLSGLMDTPMCTLLNENGIYAFRPHSLEFEKSLVALMRLFGFAVRCEIVNGIRIIKVGIQNVAVIDDIPIRDRYRDISKKPPDNRYDFMPIRDTGILKNKVKGRSIEVSGGLVVVGYSMIPIKCQIV